MMTIRIALLFLLLTSTILTSAFPVILHRRLNDIEEETDKLLFEFSIQEFLDSRTSDDPPELDFSSDGCTLSPDRPHGFNFLPGCQRHDFGYRNYKKQGRFTEDNRSKIDNNFRRDLNNECNKSKRNKVQKCKVIANAYFNVVREVGGLDL